MKELQFDKQKLVLVALVLTVTNWISFSIWSDGRGTMIPMALTGVVTLVFYYKTGCIPAFITVVLKVAKIGKIFGEVMGFLTAWAMGIGFLFVLFAGVVSFLAVGYAGVVIAYMFPCAVYPLLRWIDEHMARVTLKEYFTFGKKKKKDVEQTKVEEEVNWDEVYGNVKGELDKE